MSCNSGINNIIIKALNRESVGMRKACLTLFVLFSLVSVSSAENYQKESIRVVINGVPATVTSEETLLHKGSAARYSVKNLFDGNLQTAWVTKFDPKATVYEKEQLKIVFDKPVYIKLIKFGNGYQKNQTAFSQNQRIKVVNIEKLPMGDRGFPSGTPYPLKDILGIQTVSIMSDVRFIPDLLATKELIINFDKKFDSTQYPDLCLSEISIEYAKNSGYKPKHSWDDLKQIIYTHRQVSGEKWYWNGLFDDEDGSYYMDLVFYALSGNNEALNLILNFETSYVGESEYLSVLKPQIKAQVGIK